MALLGAADIEGMRATAAQALDGTAIVQTQAFVSDGGGGGTTAWTAAGTVDCRVAPLSGEEQVRGERLHPDSEVIVTLPAETSIDHNARVVYAGGTFAVTRVKERSEEITRRVEAKRIT